MMLQSKTGQILIGLIAVFAVTAILELILVRIHAKNSRVRTGITLLKSLAKYVAALIALLWVLFILGVDVNTILASVGIVALVVGFSAESLIADLITGIFMLFENQFNVGDTLEVNGFRGTVKEVGIRTISLEDSGNNVLIVNNSQIDTLVNLSKDQSTVACDIRVSYSENLQQVEKAINEILENMMKDNARYFLEGPCYLGVQELGDKGYVLRVTASVHEADYYSSRRILNRALLMGLQSHGIAL